MNFPLKKSWFDKRELSATIGTGSCFVIKDGKKLICACNKNGKIILEEQSIA